MGGWCKERYNKDENNELEGLHQKPDQMEETRWEGQNFSEVVAPQEEEVTSVATLTKFSHPEEGASIFLQNSVTDLSLTMWGMHHRIEDICFMCFSLLLYHHSLCASGPCIGFDGKFSVCAAVFPQPFFSF
jgi:hypothetical protein